MKTPLILLALSLLPPVSAATYKLVKLWETEPTLFAPESARFSDKDKLLFVSNLGPSQTPGTKDNDGSIAKVGLDGKIIAAEWVKGLNGPKGLGLRRGKLYVADIDRVVVIDVAQGTILQSVPLGGTGRINDLTVDENGVAYASDHGLGKIYAIKDTEVSVFVDNVKNPNGVLSLWNNFYILARGEVLQVQPDRTVKTLVTGLDPSVDGIENISGDDFIVTCAKGIIYEVNLATGASHVLLDQRESGIMTADLGYNPRTGILYVPTLFTHRVAAYQLRRASADLLPGQPYTVPDLGLNLAWIKPGEFTMGSPADEPSREPDEQLHPVKITQGFWLGTDEVTVAQWSAYVAATGYKTEAERGDGLTQIVRGQWKRKADSSWKNPGYAQTENYPVVGITWREATTFCEWLTERERAAGRIPATHRYTLPTEAEWEYACRAGSNAPYIGEGKFLSDDIWLRYGDGLGGILSESNAHPVGEKRVNPWGLYDIHGNVFEWCRDWFANYATDPATATDPTGPATGTQKVCRGGSWYSTSPFVRSAFRGRENPETRSNNLGFRVSLSAVK